MNYDFEKTRTFLANRFADAGNDLRRYMGNPAAALAAIPYTRPQQYVVAGTVQAIIAVLPKDEKSSTAGAARQGGITNSNSPEFDGISRAHPAAPVQPTTIDIKHLRQLILDVGNTHYIVGKTCEFDDGEDYANRANRADEAIEALVEYVQEAAVPVQPVAVPAGWEGAAKWLMNNYHCYSTISEICEAMLAAATSPVPEQKGDIADAYVGAREDMAIWKKRALEAEESCRRLTAALNAENGPTFMGEPAISAPSEQQAAPEQAGTPRVDALMEKWDDDSATRGSAFIELRDLARELERCPTPAGKAAAEPVGTTVAMPGSGGGFTMCAFNASDVPVGTKLYVTQSSITSSAASQTNGGE